MSILHHGTSNNIVNITYDNNLAAIFTTNGIIHQYYTILIHAILITQ